jgi:hypothetical protein
MPLAHDSMLLRRDDEAVFCHGGDLPEREAPCPVFQCSLGGTALPRATVRAFADRRVAGGALRESLRRSVEVPLYSTR